MQFHRRVLIALFFLLPAFATQAADPVISRLSPDLRVYPQYFSIEQDKLRHIYIGATNGVMRFDGGRWSWIKTSRPGAVRSLHADANGRIWVGGSDSFGYIRKQATGELEYVDLAAQFQSDLSGVRFADIWQITEYKHAIYFRGLRDLFRVDQNGNRSGYWHNDGRLGEISGVGDELWLQWRGEGLRRLSGDKFVPIEGTQGYAKSLIYNMFLRGDGSVLISDVSPRLSLWQAGKKIDLDDAGLSEHVGHLNNGLALGQDRFVFAGDDGTLRILHLSERRFDTVTLGNGFIPEVILDADGSLLAVDDEGAIKLNWPFSWLRYGEVDGIKGSVYSIDKVAGHTYLSTGTGVDEKEFSGNAPDTPFKHLDWTGNEAWQIMPDGNGGILLAESRTLNQIAGGKEKILSRDDLYPRVLLRDPRNRELIWLGTEFGPVLFKQKGNEFVEQGSNNKEPWLVSSLAASPNGILLGSEEDGLAIAIPDDTNKNGFRIEHFSDKDGIKYGTQNSAQVSAIEDGVFVSTEIGIFRLIENAFFRDGVDGLGQLLSNDEMVFIKDAENGDRWAYSYYTVYHQKKNGKWQVALNAGPSDGPFLSLTTMANGDALIGSSGQVMRYLGNNQNVAGNNATLAITAVRLNREGEPLQLLPLDAAPSFQMKGGSLEFDLGLTDYTQANGKQYQFRLEGFDNAWSEWSRQSSFRFFSLPTGKYTLHVRARSGYSDVVEGKSYSFQVVPRWYERPWLIPLAISLISFFVGAGLIQRQRNRVRNLKLRNIELDKMVSERTKDLELVNSSLQDLADRDGLTGIANRRKFDFFLEQSVQRAKETSAQLGLALLDVDHFKQYNDSHGHQAGDEILKQVGHCLSESVRGNTLVARYGGEEFAIVAPGCANDVMHALAERICLQVANSVHGVTISIGVSALDSTASDSAENLLARADAALYQAKSTGRNRVV